MCVSLWPQLRLSADSEEELIEKYRQVYLEMYVWDEHGNKRTFTGWDGDCYQFGAHAFDHAFSETSKGYRTGGLHDRFSRKRARRILWIREVLKASAGTIQRYSQTRRTDRGRQTRRRTLVVIEERYVVVFDDPRSVGKAYQFVTAFPADANYLANLKRGSFLAETKRGTR